MKPYKSHTPIAQTAEAMRIQADTFLTENGFKADAEHREMFAMFIQHSDQEEDSFDALRLAKSLRKAHANRLAFEMIAASRAEQKAEQEAKKAVEQSDVSQG